MAHHATQHRMRRLRLDTTDSSPSLSDDQSSANAHDAGAHGAADEAPSKISHTAEAPSQAIDIGRPRRACDADPSQRPSPPHRASISFNPLATTDEGQKLALGPPPHKSPQLEKGKGRSMMDELADSSSSRRRNRTHSDSDKSRYDAMTGATAEHHHTSLSYEPGEPRWPLLQSTVDQLAREQQGESRPAPLEDQSLNQQKALPAESHTAPRRSSADDDDSRLVSEEVVDSPSTDSFPSLGNSGLLPSPRVRDAPRPRASQGERPSMGAMRRLSRRTSSRSASGSAKSPASQFLSRWSRDSSVARVEPDDDGQAIGDHNEYVIGKQVGFGGFSVVKEVYSLEDGQSVLRAVKVVRKQIPDRSEEDNDKLQNEFEHEVSIWRHLRHDNILPLVSVFDSPFATFCIIPMNTGGTLYDLVRSRRKDTSRAPPSAGPASTPAPESPPMADAGVPVPIVQRYLAQLASAVRYLHEDMKIVHRDIKLENCLVTNPNTSLETGELGDILLCDFGMAEFMVSDNTDEDDVFSNAYDGSIEHFEEGDAPHNIGPSNASTNIAGSLQYASPELIKASRPLKIPAVDIWAFGVVAYALLTAELPFTHSFTPKLTMMILKGEWDVRALDFAARKTSKGAWKPESIVKLVSSCLEMDTMKRWRIQDIQRSDFLLQS